MFANKQSYTPLYWLVQIDHAPEKHQYAPNALSTRCVFWPLITTMAPVMAVPPWVAQYSAVPLTVVVKPTVTSLMVSLYQKPRVPVGNCVGMAMVGLLVGDSVGEDVGAGDGDGV